MQKINIIILSLLLFLVVLVISIFIYQKFFEVYKNIKVPNITTNNTLATNNITTTKINNTTNTIKTNSSTIKNNIETNSLTIIPLSTQNYTAIFLAPNPVSQYFFYIPLSFNSLIKLNQTCLGLEKAYYNQNNYAEIDNLLNSNNTSIFSMQGIKIIANYGNKLNENINQNNIIYKCVYGEQ